jgi:GTPase SAR1 family protein
MGISGCWRREDNHTRILLLGAPKSGKSTILKQLKAEEQFGTSYRLVIHQGNRYKICEVIGDIEYLDKPFQNPDGVMYVIDSANVERIDDVIEDMKKALTNSKIKKSPFLIYCNKLDVRSGLSLIEMKKKLTGVNMKGRKWHLQACCATKGEGVGEGLLWFQKNK